MARRCCLKNIEDESVSYFDGKLLGQIGTGVLMLLAFLLPLLPAGGLFVFAFTANLPSDILMIVYAFIGVYAFFMLWLGLAWATVISLRWQYRHTTINNQRLVFKGKTVALWGNFLKWFFLFVITLTIYGLWIWIKLRKWIIKNVTVADCEEMETAEQNVVSECLPVAVPYFPPAPPAPCAPTPCVTARYAPTPYPPQPQVQMSYYPTCPYMSPCPYANKQNKKKNWYV